MSGGGIRWHHDPHRNAHYWICEDEEAYVYEDGSRLPMPPAALVALRSRQASRNVASMSTIAVGNPYAGSNTAIPRDDSSVSSVSHPRRRGSSSSQQYSVSSWTTQPVEEQEMNELQRQMAVLQTQYNYGGFPTGTYPQPVHGSASSASGATIAGSSHRSRKQQSGTDEVLTDPKLASIGIEVKGKIRGTQEDADTKRLFPEFKIQHPGKKFFKTGKVFKVLWPELAGRENESITVTSDGKHGERVATKIRWFVVVMEGKNFCTCLPINTYGRKGVAKKGVVKCHHAIAYSSKEEPPPRDNERPSRGEYPMLVGIRINPKRKGDKLHAMSRIDFSRMYTVEHNVKVYDFGETHERYRNVLTTQWITLVTSQVSGHQISSIPEEGGAEGSEGDDDDDEGDEGGQDSSSDDNEERDDHPRREGSRKRSDRQQPQRSYVRVPVAAYGGSSSASGTKSGKRRQY